MCFNYKTSLLNFVLGTIGSLVLIKYGNPKFKSDNTAFGIFGIFIACIQLMDFLFWIDLRNKTGINHIMTIFGPLLNVGQPIILYIIKLLYFVPKKMDSTNLSVAVLNGLYMLYLLQMYYKFFTTEKNLTTTTKHGHLDWSWLKYANPYFYLILFAINIFYLTNFNYSLLFFIITYFLLYLSIKFFSYSPGQLWCFFSSSIPIFMIVCSHLLL